MFGRIRASPSHSPVEWLEMERQIPPSKHFKDDSLSIYEATLVKLKQGSQRSLSSDHNLCQKMSEESRDLMDLEPSRNMSEDSSKVAGSSVEQENQTLSSSSDGSASVSISDQEHKKGRELSIQFLFAKYNTAHQKQGSPFCENLSLSSNSANNSGSESAGS